MFRWKHFASNSRRIRAYLESLLSSREDAADLLQDVGMVLLARDQVPPDEATFVCWCRGIARNLALHHWRAAHRYNEVFADSDPEAVESDAASEWLEEGVADRESVCACLRDLDEQTRSMLIKRYVDEETSREIGRELRQSPAAVRMKIKRARAAIRASARSG